VPSNISISGGVKGRPRKLLKTPATQAIYCPLCFHVGKWYCRNKSDTNSLLLSQALIWLNN
jgi:hypothetical protein